MGLLAENRKATIWETLNESVHHMASMDLKTGNKLEGQRPGQARPRRLLMPMGEREGARSVRATVELLWDHELQSRSQVSFAYRKRGRAEGGGGWRGRLFFEQLMAHMLSRRT